MWKSATRPAGIVTAKADGGNGGREVNSSGWEHRRGSEPHGRMDGTTDRLSSVGLLSRTRKRNLLLEGERKTKSGEKPEGKPTGELLGGKRQSPSRKAQRT